MPKIKKKKKSTFSPSDPHTCVIYGRMSSDMQNPGSPDQQEREIRKKVNQLNVPWNIVKVYSDSAISGRTHDRPGLQRMLADLKSGRVRADVVLVDTFERLSRSENAHDLRTELSRRGIFVLTLDSGFADPTSAVGQLNAVFESVRAVDNNRVKAHEVRRGKNDNIRRGDWPGGKPPFGFKLDLKSKEVRHQKIVYHHRLVEDERTAWIVREIFRLADQNGWGGIRIAKHLNRDERILTYGAILQDTTIARILKNPIYIGRMEYGKRSREAAGDAFFLEDNDQCEWEVNETFCAGIIDREVWDRVQALFERRKRPSPADTDYGTESLAGPGSGVALKYPLSGLVVCASCGRAMVAGSSAPYTTSSGEIHEYVYYGCPGTHSRICDNRTTIPEPQLRKSVIQLVLKRLFLGDIISSSEIDASSLASQIMENPDFHSFIDSVTSMLLEYQPDGAAARDGLIRKRDELQSLCDGWLRTLGDPSIGHALRTAVQGKFVQTSTERDRINTILSSEQVELEQLQTLASPSHVAMRLAQLWQIICDDHASLMNVTLAEHIDVIWCFPNRTVQVRFCRLGALTDPGGLTSIPGLKNSEQPAGATLSRRRMRRNLSNATCDEESCPSKTIDPRRFSELHEHWFEVENVTIPERRHWYQENARIVAEYRLSNHATMDELSRHFDRTTPTIRAALRFAEKEYGIHALGKKLSMSTWKTWSRLHASEVADFLARPGASKAAAAAHFGKSPHAINSALKIAEEFPSEMSETIEAR